MEITDGKSGRTPKFFEAGILMLLICSILIYFNIGLGISSLIALFVALVFCSIFALFWGYSWKSVEKMMLDGLKKSLMTMVINLLIGMLIAAWCAGGTVPYIVYIGLKLISPRWFLVITLMVCCIMSTCTGSSWTTAGTVGIAMFGIGTAMGIPPGLVVGPILAGSYFGDKLSPVSESTNLASGIAESPILEHVHSMLFVVIPSTLISGIIFGVMGWKYGGSGLGDISSILDIENGLQERFWLNPLLLLPLIVMGILIFKRAPAILTMAIAILMGILLALTQGCSFVEISDAMVNGFQANTAVEAVNKMLSKGGINAMRNTIYILIFGMPMGGILQGTHTLETLVFHFKGLVNTRFAVITGSLFCVMLMSAVCGDSYAAYIITVAAFGAAHDRLQLDRKVLSRSCEMGVVCCCLMGWTAGGSYMSGLFGVEPTAYMPYYYWGYLIFIFNMICAATGFGIFYTNGRRGWGKHKEIPAAVELENIP